MNQVSSSVTFGIASPINYTYILKEDEDNYNVTQVEYWLENLMASALGNGTNLTMTETSENSAIGSAESNEMDTKRVVTSCLKISRELKPCSCKNVTINSTLSVAKAACTNKNKFEAQTQTGKVSGLNLKVALNNSFEQQYPFV